MEARAGIEPAYRSFADSGLTTWLPRQRLKGMFSYKIHPFVTFKLFFVAPELLSLHSASVFSRSGSN